MASIRRCSDGKIGVFMPNGDEIPCVFSYGIDPLCDENKYGNASELSVTLNLLVKNELFIQHDREKDKDS